MILLQTRKTKLQNVFISIYRRDIYRKSMLMIIYTINGKRWNRSAVYMWERWNKKSPQFLFCSENKFFVKVIFKIYFCDSVAIKYLYYWKNFVIEGLSHKYWRNNFCDLKILLLVSFQNVLCSTSKKECIYEKFDWNEVLYFSIKSIYLV